MRRRGRIGAAAVLIVAGLVSVPPAVSAQGGTFLSMASQPGDYIGQGLNYYYFTPATASFTPTYDGSLARFGVTKPDYSEWWYVTIAAPPGQPLVAGSYTNAVRAEFRNAGSTGSRTCGAMVEAVIP